MSEDNEKDNGSKAANTLKDRPDKKPDLHNYKSEDKDAMEEEKLQDESKSERRNDESLPAGA